MERPSVVKRDLMPSMGHNVAEVMFLDINAKELDLDLKKKHLSCVPPCPNQFYKLEAEEKEKSSVN